MLDCLGQLEFSATMLCEIMCPNFTLANRDTFLRELVPATRDGLGLMRDEAAAVARLVWLRRSERADARKKADAAKADEAARRKADADAKANEKETARRKADEENWKRELERDR